ncbi:hypothetical protein OG369_39855 [Streptomyces sp. NBC_01221]|uniref:hypothetical protein n=1 Tax=Streptomyces sp. NBC_01221 TaxID=2903782 RepID=UPI00224E3549|nr:hypothetical protein [Streptomyces sp. NBC_01221]MCX4789694.1 hypothetical protein [Streptomyces sp. NBC_01221]MCX4792005.1 hypothetical protein [Streptomyces sp. NBC_01221]
MSNDLRDKFVRALQATEGTDPLSRLTRAGLQASASKFSGLGLLEAAAGPGLNFRLADPANGGLIAANEVGDFLQRVQKAVARLAKARRARLADVVKLLPLDFELARLDVAASAAGSIIVDLQPHMSPVGEERDQLTTDASVSWAEVGAVELVRALPEGPEDEESMDSLFSASPVLRRAVSDLIFDLPNPDLDISLAVQRRTGERIVASLSAGQAASLRDRLNIIREEREIIRMRGRLDGLRTRRQIFYFEPPSGAEIHGFVDESLVGVVRAHLDEEVDVALESFVLRSAAGKRSQRRYRLIEVAGQQSQLPPGSELDDEV